MTSFFDVSNTIARWFTCIDRRNWAAAESLMTNPFHLDYSSFGGGPAAALNPRDISANWARLLPGFDATHHQLGNLEISCDEKRAVVNCYVTASHFIASADDSPVWIVVGSYEFSLVSDGERWLLSGCRFDFKFQHGNIDLPALAQQRA